MSGNMKLQCILMQASSTLHELFIFTLEKNHARLFLLFKPHFPLFPFTFSHVY